MDYLGKHTDQPCAVYTTNGESGKPEWATIGYTR